MDNHPVLEGFHRLDRELVRIETALEDNQWEKVQQSLGRINKIQKELQSHADEVDGALKSGEGPFPAEYTDRRDQLQSRIQGIVTAIKAWIEGQTERIAQSRDVIQNRTRYQGAAGSTAYYIDKKK